MWMGGAPNHLVHVLERLDRRRFAPLLCCLTTDRKESALLLDKVRALDVPILDAQLRDAPNALGRPHSFLQMARLARELKRRRVRIVHSYLFHANWFGTLTARLARIPVAIVSRRSIDVYPRARDRWACRIADRLADCVIAVAQAVRDHAHVTDGCPLGKIVVIPNGIARLPPSAGVDPSAALQVGAGEHVIGTISRLVWKRGNEELLEAAALVRQAIPSATLVVVGDGPRRAALEARARELGLNGGVRFLGAVPQAARLLPHFDVFVLSSVLEGMSNSLLEAMAAGRPVVATRVGGNPEVVVEGETGFLVPPRDARALADAVLRLLRDRELAHRFGQAARRRVESQFTLEQMVQRMEDLYADLLARKRAA
jgi:glycosyltransferase involved in cell wall biosynthesis